MQRSFLVPVILALLAAGAYFEREPLLALWRQGYDRVSKGAGATPEPGSAENPTSGTPGTPGAPGAPGSPENPGQPSGRKHAVPGTFYMVERAKVISASGVKAVNPGESVKLLERLSNNRLRVTVGDADFVVKQSQVTDDGAVADEAERRYRMSPSSL